MTTQEHPPAGVSRSRGTARDLAMGVRFAVNGGREGWIRLLLTAVGVGLGVALLLLTAAVPHALSVRHERGQARQDYTYGPTDKPKADDTLVIAETNDWFREKDIRGRLLEPEGPRAPLPPGVERFPAAGEMLVSPALQRLLASDSGKALRKRLPFRIAGTIGESGLIGSHELSYYVGARHLAPRIDGSTVARIDRFGEPDPTPARMDPILVLLTLVMFLVLLMPVVVFIATAVRFGGERRDRRLAALRLIGSDGGMTRRIAAGEALAGALLGMVLGTGFFVIVRQVAGAVEVLGVSVFPGDLTPSPALAVLVAVAVPTAAVLVTLFALRQVVIEPLGVVRTAMPRRRRLWWRLLLPVGGLAMLYPMMGQGDNKRDYNPNLVTGGVVLLLIGVSALLPWVIEAVVARIGRGGISWQLAVRRLQLSSGTAARSVNGIVVAVAGAIALQMLFGGVSGHYTTQTKNDLSRAQVQVNLPDGVRSGTSAKKFTDTKGVLKVAALGGGTFLNGPEGPAVSLNFTVGDCASLRELAKLPSCRDGDMFLTQLGAYASDVVKPGKTLYLAPGTGGGRSSRVSWTVPGRPKVVQPTDTPTGRTSAGILITPGAVPERVAAQLHQEIYLSLDRSVPDAIDNIRTTAAQIDMMADTVVWSSTQTDTKFASLRTGLFVGAACVLALIGASMLVSQLEQLRERRKLLSSLVAFGTRRRTLGLSVLWQSAIPVALGLLLASVIGVSLGAVLLSMTGESLRVDWGNVLSMTGIGAGVVLLVTLLSLPPLMRMVRPDGLRTE